MISIRTIANYARLITMLMLAAGVALASTPDDYRVRLDAARAELTELISMGDDVEGYDPEYVESYIANLKRAVPASERIERTDGTAVETSNAWFHQTLDAAFDPANSERREELLRTAEMRLEALSFAVETESSLGQRSKDDDKRKLNEILNREEYQKPAAVEQESQAAVWLRKFLNWLEGLFPNIGGSPANDTGMQAVGTVGRFVAVGLVLLLAAFILYKLYPVIARKLRQGTSDVPPERVILGETISADRSSTDLFHEAEQLARSGDARAAIRKGYVALLCELSDRNIIGLARHKTNRDYLREVRKRGEVHTEMRGITGSFEEHWYGERPAGPVEWEEFRRRCGKTIEAI